jgi:hypothetical protein
MVKQCAEAYVYYTWHLTYIHKIAEETPNNNLKVITVSVPAIPTQT